MNFIDHIFAQDPNKIALTFPKKNRFSSAYTYHNQTFGDLCRDADAFARGLQQQGVEPGDQVLLLVKPTREFFIIVCGLFKLGALPVFIDPGMGWRNFLEAVKTLRPKVLIAEPAVHWLRRGLSLHPILRSTFSELVLAITTSTRGYGLALPLRNFLQKFPDIQDFPSYNADPDALAALLFTSGGTGTPKGVAYGHRMFTEQVRQIHQLFAFSSEDIHLAGFPPFALLTLAMGVTSVIAPLNPSRPASADPRALLQVINERQITRVSGSPAIWQNLARYCRENSLTLAQLRAVMMFGAPVQGDLHEIFADLLPAGSTYTPYGATECLPVSSLDGGEILRETLALTRQGKGTCIGRPVSGLQVKIIAPHSGAIASLDEVLECGSGEVGEVIVRGPQASRYYFHHDEATRFSKIPDKDGSFWHRMGDLAYFDALQRLWFCGRKVHRVECQGTTWDPIPCEAIFRHPQIRRAALIKVGTDDDHAVPGMVIEREDRRTRLEKLPRTAFRQELRALAQAFPHTRGIHRFFLCREFPVDTRHNIKIDRLALQRSYGSRLSRYEL